MCSNEKERVKNSLGIALYGNVDREETLGRSDHQGEVVERESRAREIILLIHQQGGRRSLGESSAYSTVPGY